MDRRMAGSQKKMGQPTPKVRTSSDAWMLLMQKKSHYWCLDVVFMCPSLIGSVLHSSSVSSFSMPNMCYFLLDFLIYTKMFYCSLLSVLLTLFPWWHPTTSLTSLFSEDFILHLSNVPTVPLLPLCIHLTVTQFKLTYSSQYEKLQPK